MPGVLCEHCTAMCCRYVALPIDEPETRSDFDDMRWYLLHEGISIFVEDDTWHINIQTNCRHLQPDFRCGIYETRPKICRDYTTDNCDYHSGDYGWQHNFSTPDQLEEFARDFLRDKRRRKRGHKATKKRGGVRARLKDARGRKKKPATVDLRGVPLPVLRALS